MTQVIFIILSLVTLGSALAVVTNRNLFHSAIFLALSFFGMAGLYLMLQAEFLAGIQILIYVGAIVTLIIFAIMLSRDLTDPEQDYRIRQWPIAGGVVALIFVALAFTLTRIPWPTSAPAAAPSATFIADLGKAFVDQRFVLPFEAVSVLLLVALVGSIIIARER